MKILVFSDSHRSRAGMLDAIDAHAPDQVIHLGDLQEDAEELTYVYPRLPICMVPGNCDGWTMEPLKKQITLAGKRFCSPTATSGASSGAMKPPWPTPGPAGPIFSSSATPTRPCANSWRTACG